MVTRSYQHMLAEHLRHDTQMLFLCGHRQVGKTTLAHSVTELGYSTVYFSWDYDSHRKLILQGQQAIADHAGLDSLQTQKPVILFDELHKFTDWKNFLKGFYDLYKDEAHILVTGSARLDLFQRGGDSLMGRYFLYHIHPLSIAEILNTDLSDAEIRQPIAIDPEQFQALLKFGGFPEPYTKKNPRFSSRWQRLRWQQLFREDIRDSSRVQELKQLELLAELLTLQAGQLINYSNLATKVRVSSDTIRRWVNELSSFYFGFTIKPWSTNISRSLIKEPKFYVHDWSIITDIGARAENFIACHLLKATQCWTDRGLGTYELYFLRDKEKREVDFLVTRNQIPWFLVEVKSGENHSLSPALAYFQQQTQALHAFQVVIDKPFILQNCFTHHKPIQVPASTFLSQLV